MSDLIAGLAAAGVHTLLLQFTDAQGVAKGKYLPLHQLPVALATGAGFAGPSIVATGLPRTGPRSEFYARGDASTLRALPFMPGVAPASGESTKISCPPGPDASTMPSDSPKRILRGARLATTTVSRPTSCDGS